MSASQIKTYVLTRNYTELFVYNKKLQN